MAKPNPVTPRIKLGEVFVIIGILIIFSVLGYVIYTSLTNPQQTPVAEDVDEAPQIESADDLDKALDVLEQSDPAGSNNDDAKLLEQQLDNF